MSSGEGGKAGVPGNCSGVKVRYLHTGDSVLEGQVPGRDVSEGQVLGIEITLIWFQPDEILRSLKLFPAGLAALPLPSPQALRPRPSDQCDDF